MSHFKIQMRNVKNFFKKLKHYFSLVGLAVPRWGVNILMRNGSLNRLKNKIYLLNAFFISKK